MPCENPIGNDLGRRKLPKRVGDRTTYSSINERSDNGRTKKLKNRKELKKNNDKIRAGIAATPAIGTERIRGRDSLLRDLSFLIDGLTYRII